MSASAELYGKFGPALIDEGVIKEEGPPHQRVFTVAVSVHGRRFEGTGGSKKAAKNDACRIALDTFNLKRPATDNGVGERSEAGTPKPKRPKTFTTEGMKDFTEFAERHQKTALSALNEMYGGRAEWLSGDSDCRRGAPHEPIFQAKVQVEGQLFVGYGARKKDSKQDAAFKALRALVDGCSSAPQHESSALVVSSATQLDDANSSDMLDSSTGETASQALPSAMQKLNELHPGLEYNVSEVLGTGFHAEISVRGRTFTANAESKREACHLAARDVLKDLYDFDMAALLESAQRSESLMHPLSGVCSMVAKLTCSKFSELQVGLQQETSGRNVVAAFVMCSKQTWSVVSLGTGMKTINASQLCADGKQVRDCHAEVVARRAFKRFLVRHLNWCIADYRANQKGEIWVDRSIFCFNASGKVMLKPEIEFHFYVSVPPCGDVFVTGGRGHGQLRHKVPVGEGTEPSLLAFDDPGNRWRKSGPSIMSCSDKILSWTVLGVQGSLLSLLLRPIYIRSIVIGAQFHHNTTQRALHHRLEGFAPPPAFDVCRPVLDGLQAPMRRDVSRAANVSFNWSCGDETLELLEASSGARVDGVPSRLCKYHMFAEFSQMLQKFHKLMPEKIPVLPAELSYQQAKALSKSYSSAKAALVSHLEAQFGRWQVKPEGTDHFSLGEKTTP